MKCYYGNFIVAVALSHPSPPRHGRKMPPDIGVTQIAHRLGVSPATLYRYIAAARAANTPGV
jgi:hypothetical protein